MYWLLEASKRHFKKKQEFSLIQARGASKWVCFLLQVERPAPTRRACKWGSLCQGRKQPTARLLNVMKIVAVKNARNFRVPYFPVIKLVDFYPEGGGGYSREV